MPEQVNGPPPRRYDGTRRREAAERTRSRILSAARDLFLSAGYADTSVADIARRAGVSVDTIYASAGRKPQLLLAAHDMVLAEGDRPVAALERDYVRAVRAASGAREKIRVYARALARVLPGSVPLLVALREAGSADEECRSAWEAVAERRAANMRLFAADLRGTGELRDDLDDDQVATLVWSMNGPDYFGLIASRGHTPDEYADLLIDVWTRVLLAHP